MAAWVDAWAHGFHKTGTNAIQGHTAEADDPPVAVMSSRSSHVQSWRPARCPRFRLISEGPCAEKKKGPALCLACWPKVRQFPTSWVLLGMAGKAGTRPRLEDPHPCR